jgi:hypothetical protein
MIMQAREVMNPRVISVRAGLARLETPGTTPPWGIDSAVFGERSYSRQLSLR